MIKDQRLLLLTLCWALLAGCGKTRISVQWTAIETGTTQDLNSVCLAGNQLFIAGGIRYDSALLASSADGGVHWNKYPDTIHKALYCIRFQDADTGFATGYDGKILKTTDAGLHWSLYQSMYFPIRSIFYAGHRQIITVGGNGWSRGEIHRSADEGNSWDNDTLANELRDVFFTSPANGFACGYGAIFQTTDGGASWNYTKAKGDLFTSICFTNSLTGVCCGFSGTLLKTTDGGNTWKTIRNGSNLLNASRSFNQLVFRSPLEGYLVGDEGVFWKTLDGGDHWDEIKNTPSGNWKAIALIPGGGYIVGSGGKMYRFAE